MAEGIKSSWKAYIKHIPWRSFFTLRNLLLCAAMLFFWKSLRLNSFPIILIGTTYEIDEFPNSVILILIFALSQLGVLVLLFSSTHIRKYIFYNKRVIIITALVGLISVLVAYQHFQELDSTDILLSISILFIGIMVSLLTICIGQIVINLGLWNSLFVSIISFIIYSIIDVTFSRMLNLEGLIIYFILTIICTTVICLPFNISNSTRSLTFATLRDLPWGGILVGVIFACFGSIIISSVIGMSIGSFSSTLTMSLIYLGITLLLLLIFGASAWLAIRLHRAQSAPILMLLICVICWCIALMAIYFNVEWRFLSPLFDHIFILIVWMIMICSLTQRKLSALLCVGVIYALFIIGQYFFASSIVYNVGLISLLASQTSQTFTLIILIMLAIIVIAVILIYRLLRKTNDISFTQPENPQEVCNRAFSNTDLTEREREVGSALYRGYSIARISQDIGVSQATIKTHANHIYHKLGIHSRQDLIRYIDSFKDTKLGL